MKQIMTQLFEQHQHDQEQLAHLETRVQQLTTTVSELSDQLAALTKLQHKLGHITQNLQGRTLELVYYDKAAIYFGRLLERPKVIPLNRLWQTLEGHLTAQEFDDVLLSDLVVVGKPRHRPNMGLHWLVVEIASVATEQEVHQAWRRAKLMRRAGYRGLPVVACEALKPGVKQEALAHGVAILHNEQCFLWLEALTIWSSSADDDSNA